MLLIRKANQWTGFYMITASVMKELKSKNNGIFAKAERLFFLSLQTFLVQLHGKCFLIPRRIVVKMVGEEVLTRPKQL